MTHPSRRLLLSLPLAAAVAGCGFQLRQTPTFAFSSISLAAATPLAEELRRNLQSAGALTVYDASVAPIQADVALDILSEQRQKVVVGRNASGQVREFQLRMVLRFRLRSKRGLDLIAETELLQSRDISFNETAVLAKEAEEGLLYRDMQTDLVQQVMRRLAAVKTF